MPFVPYNHRQNGSLREPVSPCTQEQIRPNWKRLLGMAGLFFLVLAVTCGLGTPAWASCGDYVQTFRSQTHASNIPQKLSSHEAGGAALAKAADPISSQPCQGPHCRKPPISPIFPLQVPSQSEPSHEKAASPTLTIAPELISCLKVTLYHPAKPVQHSKQRVERPPRRAT